MEKLPAGYRVVAGISVGYAALLGLILIPVLRAALAPVPPYVLGPYSFSNPNWPRAWLDLIGAWVLPPAGLVVLGCMLFTRSRAVQRRAVWAALGTAATLVLQAGLLLASFVSVPPDDDAVVWWVILLFSTMLPLTWAVVLFATGLRLGRRLQRPAA